MIEKARARADAVLAAARSKMDRQWKTRPPSATSPQTLENERVLEDQTLRRERADADETLLAERAEHAALLAAEREETDRDLSRCTAPGGKVLVHVKRIEDEIRLTVSDTGMGIPNDQLDAVFKRFLQVHHDRRGVGLGLYISKCIVQGHGGRIGVESKMGVGSKFTFTLPIVPTLEC